MSPIPRSPRNENRRPRQRGRTYLSPQRSHSLGGRMFEVGHFTTHRRGFLGRIAASAAAFGLGGLVAPFAAAAQPTAGPRKDRKSTRLNSSHLVISYAVFCLKKKKMKRIHDIT